MITLGKLNDLYQNPEIMEIFVDGPHDVYWEDREKMTNGEGFFKDNKEVKDLIKDLYKSTGRDSDDLKRGFGDFKLADGTRVAFTLPPISTNGPTLTIRKLPQEKMTVENLLKFGAVNKEGWELCCEIANGKGTVLLAGNVGSGKTTVANLLLDSIDKEMRLITVEKISEVETENRRRTVRLETPHCKQGEMKDLIQVAGKLRADSIYINELMGAETFEALKLMREGNHILAGICADGASDALKRCELYCLMDQPSIGLDEIKYHVANAVDYVIYQERREDGKRVIAHIAKVEGLDEDGRYLLKPLYTHE